MFLLVCSTPRVGSNLLQRLLYDSGVAGDLKEFLGKREILAFGAKHCGFQSLEEATRDFDRYIRAMQAHYTRGAWFAIKAQFMQLCWATENGLDLAQHYPDRFVYLRRADVVAQAISFVRAMQTEAWTARKAEAAEPRYDQDSISMMLGEIVLENEQWEGFFRSLQVEPYRMTYEGLCADGEGELTRLLRFLDVDPGGIDVAGAVRNATSRMRVQRDEISAEWRRLYDEHVRRSAILQSQVMAAARSKGAGRLAAAGVV